MKWSGEMQMVSWTDSGRNGPRVTFALTDRKELESFIGKEGSRFMGAVVEIGDDELPVDPPTPDPPPVQATPSPPDPPAAPAAQSKKPRRGAGNGMSLGPLCSLAVRWCKEPVFQRWMFSTFGVTGPVDDWEAFARSRILQVCTIESRKDLDTDPAAANNFKEFILGPFRPVAEKAGLQ